MYSNHFLTGFHFLQFMKNMFIYIFMIFDKDQVDSARRIE